jgi:hypothetical protein
MEKNSEKTNIQGNDSEKTNIQETEINEKIY